VELITDDELDKLPKGAKNAYMDIMTTISDVIITGINPKIGN